MPFVNKPVPTLPSLVARADFTWSYAYFVGSNYSLTMGTSFYWTMDQATPGGWSKSTWHFALLNFWQNLMGPWFPGSIAFQFGWGFMNDAGTDRSVFLGSSISGADSGDFLSTNYCPLIRKFTTVPGRNGMGRSYLPPLPKQYIDKQGFTSAGYSLIAAAVDTVNAPIVDQGVTYTPAVYFPSMLACVETTRCDLFMRPVVRRSRMLNPPETEINYIYPIVG